jgi:hypothetical protein
MHIEWPTKGQYTGDAHSDPQDLCTTPWSTLPYFLDFIVKRQDKVVHEQERSSGIGMPCPGSAMDTINKLS